MRFSLGGCGGQHTNPGYRAASMRSSAPGSIEEPSLTYPQRAGVRARGGWLFVEFRGFSRARNLQRMLTEWPHTVYRLPSKKPLPWRVTGASVAHHVERPWAYITEPAPQLQPMCCARSAPRTERSCVRSTWKLGQSTLEKGATASGAGAPI